MANIKDLTSQRFGRLVALERTDQRHRNCYLWRCKCDCGNEALVSTYFLTHGLSRSCGCLQEEARKADIAGQRFGRLVAIEPVGKHTRGITWLCECDCGKTVEVKAASLLQGQRRSCGCLHVETAAKQAATGIWEGNLRDGTNIKNIASDAIYSSNKSGYRGVSWHKGRGMWVARISFKGVTYWLGYYRNIEDAVKARKVAEKRYFGEYLESIEEKEKPPVC